MAILKGITTNAGIEISNAYARIDSINGSKQSINISLNYYLTQQAFSEGKSYLQQEVYIYEPSVEDHAPNFIKQGYEHLKLLEEFSGATDA